MCNEYTKYRLAQNIDTYYLGDPRSTIYILLHFIKIFQIELN